MDALYKKNKNKIKIIIFIRDMTMEMTYHFVENNQKPFFVFDD